MPKKNHRYRIRINEATEEDRHVLATYIGMPIEQPLPWGFDYDRSRLACDNFLRLCEMLQLEPERA